MRLGRIGYINCFPVYRAIDRGIVSVHAELVSGTPSELNGLLAGGELDVSVVSAVEYARHAGSYNLLPDMAVSCDGPVRSVALFSRRRAQDLDGATVLVSESSRTSVHLLELLCSEVWDVAPNLAGARTEAPDLDTLRFLPHDAVLVIGDAALLLTACGQYPYKYDLGQEWKRWTGLPFVFAVWAARKFSGPDRAGISSERHEHEVRRIQAALAASKRWGLTNLAELASDASAATGLDPNACFDYLNGLDYALSYKHLEGLTSFFRRLASAGTVPDGTLTFLSAA